MLSTEELLLYRTILSTEDWLENGHSLLPNVKNWLFEEGSLTKKLQGISYHFAVNIISQQWLNEKTSEKTTALSQSQATWLREVILQGDKQNWIFAQTIFSHSLMQKLGTDITELGTTPIGTWLFPQKPQRSRLEWHQDPKTSLYARRSRLYLANDYLEVRELFLAKFDFNK